MHNKYKGLSHGGNYNVTEERIFNSQSVNHMRLILLRQLRILYYCILELIIKHCQVRLCVPSVLCPALQHAIKTQGQLLFAY